MTEVFTPDEATRAQIGAADPSGSVWLAANAGSGKTRVLTDRVAWLLLEGTPPERILCLTYTKAAAGEMQNRLFARLGTWAMMPDPELRKQLFQMGVATGRISSDRLRHARTLFARAIETPGGLKIQTIHAFCASLLRRFPLEAGVSPAFSEMDETATARLHAAILDQMAEGPDAPLVDAMSARLTDSEPSAFLADVARAWPQGTAPLDEAALRMVLGVGSDTEDSIRAGAITADHLDVLETVRDITGRSKAKTMATLHAGLAQAILAAPEDRLDLLTPVLLTQAKAPRKIKATKDVAEDLTEDLLADLTQVADDIAQAHARIGALASLDYAMALHAFAPAFMARLEAAKQARGWLDFDDQIARARHLLSTSDMAQWVLFKLDGGLDHILVDEAQDTAPAQWDVISALAAEFGAGHGARQAVTRTLFVVGDRKQSIYSFQGAEPDAFDRMRAVFASTLPQEAAALRDHAMRHSFRSSPVILDLVDAVFADGGGLGAPPEHLAFHQAMPGRVDLWPAIAQEEPDHSDRQWHDPIDRPAANDAEVLLAKRVACTIRQMIDDRVPIGHGEARRPVTEGDILILLQRRRSLFHHVIRECKALDLDLAGADRLKLSGDLAVRDLIALLTWAATPDDDLSLATVLRSPLGGLDEAALFQLTQGRKRATVWDALRDSAHDTTLFDDILRVADILRPYEILQRVLIRHGGRQALLARLGPERDEAIEALLGQALTYEALEVPSLAGFLGWLASADVDVKRQAGRGSIRVMSVHGAKGLESPVVILPETQVRRAKTPTGVRRLPDGPPIWMPSKAGWSPALRDLADDLTAAQIAERDRLLYVALTRAESWLIVCAAGNVGEAPQDSWWKQVEAGMRARGAAEDEEGALRLETGDWSALPAPSGDPSAYDTRPALPPWTREAVVAPRQSPKPIAPSALPGPKALPGDAGDDQATAMARGTAIHLLLEHLPAHPEAQWPEMARRIAPDATPETRDEALAVLRDSDLAPLFHPDTLAEVPFALPVNPPYPAVAGTFDRVALDAGSVMIVDFKSNAIVPDTAAAVPGGVLAQLGAYLAAAQGIWPDRQIRLAILWTRTQALMEIPHDLVTRAWDAAAGIDPAGGDP